MNAITTATGNITCGHCKRTSQTVQHVRECSIAHYAGRPATTPAQRVVVPTQPRHTAPPVTDVKLQPGRYAITVLGMVEFYKIDMPVGGRWDGYTFVKRIVGSDEWPVRNSDLKARVIRDVKADMRGAMELYGREIGECGHCGRQLTNEESRKVGIGPICRGRMGW